MAPTVDLGVCVGGGGCLHPALVFLQKSWSMAVRGLLCLSEPLQVGASRSMSLCGRVCFRRDHLNWVHAQPPGVGPWFSERTVPSLMRRTRKRGLEGVSAWVPVCEAVPAGAWIPPRVTSVKTPNLPEPHSTLASTEWCIWHVARLKQNNYTKCLERRWLLISPRSVLAGVVTLTTRTTGHLRVE